MTDQEIYDRTRDAVPEQTRLSVPDEEYYQQPRAPQQTGRVARLGALLVIVGLIWLAVELFGYGPFFGGSQGVGRLDVPLPDNQIELDLGSGDVAIQAADGQEARIETIQYGLWWGNPTAVSRSGGSVRVANEAEPAFFGLCFGRCGLSYRIALPRGVNMTVRTRSGDIDVAGAAGAVSLTTSSGDVEAHDIANGITVATSSGDVTLNRVVGKLEVQTSSGDIGLGDGRVVDVTAATSSGNINLDGVAGAITLKSSSGDITASDARDGQLDIQTNSGEVAYTGSLTSASDSSITGSSGDVTLHLPANSGFVLEANTSSGDLQSDFDLRSAQHAARSLTGSAGAGGARLKITTSSGDITIARQ